MTTIAVWKVETIESHLGNPAIWIVSDSRASMTASNGSSNTLTDKCAKLIEVEINASIKNKIIKSTILIAVAGNTLVAHNTVFAAQLALKNLVGDRFPTLHEVATYLSEFVTSITKEVAVIHQKSSECELVIIGTENNIVNVYSIKPYFLENNGYLVEKIEKFPYVFGIDSKTYEDAIKKELKEIKSDDSNYKGKVDQRPIIVFDRIFFTDKKSPKTGGELQIVAVGTKKLQRYMPHRWNDSTQEYEYYMFGENTWKKRIGECSIGILPWQLSDIK
jgi:hypothetical protein